MLTCPHCLNTFEPSDSSRSCCVAAHPSLQLLAPTSPCLRVFADSGGGLVLTSADKPSFIPNQPQSVHVTFAQPSPSVQLSFVLPPTPAPTWFPPTTNPPLNPPPIPPRHDVDLVRISGTQRALRASGWYYEGLSWQESAATLERSTPGTFLVRDSSDPRFLFSLSVQTTRGPTSVRIHYLNGQFRLDSEERLASYIPMFNCVLKLVEHYVELGKRKQQDSISNSGNNSNSSSSSSNNSAGCSSDKERHVWVDLSGHMYSPILLTKPKRHMVPPLQHLARIAINQRLKVRPRNEALPALNLPPSIKEFLREYPYTQ